MFDALTVLQCIAGERCLAIHGVPTMFISEPEHPRFTESDLSSPHTGVMASWRATGRGSKESIAAIRLFREHRTERIRTPREIANSQNARLGPKKVIEADRSQYGTMVCFAAIDIDQAPLCAKIRRYK